MKLFILYTFYLTPGDPSFSSLIKILFPWLKALDTKYRRPPHTWKWHTDNFLLIQEVERWSVEKSIAMVTEIG